MVSLSDIVQIISTFAGTASGAGVVVWWVFNRELGWIGKGIDEAKKSAGRAHVRLDQHLEKHH
jgi:hypothetical protein